MTAVVGRRSLPEWLRWQETLHPHWIALGLERVQAVSSRMGVARPAGPVFTVAGTNGKGSTVTLIEAFLRHAGQRVGLYTSPHLVTYNERVRVGGRAASDAQLEDAFERVEAARGDTPLTFFEFGTLAAFEVFRTSGCDAWVLEVGMGGRLDAVNIIDPDYALITTVGLDHQEYLGHTVEQIAAEKAGILRAGRPGFYGDWPTPGAIRDLAREIGCELRCLGHDFDFTPARPAWSWRGREIALDYLAYPLAATSAQLRNISLVLAAIECYRPALLGDADGVNGIIMTARPPGRFQIVERRHEWVLDVAHNPQAVATLRAQLQTLPAANDCTVVFGVLGDKDLAAFPLELAEFARRWVVCSITDPRGRSAASTADALRQAGAAGVLAVDGIEAALSRAEQDTAPGGRIIVCGSFRVVGPALCWLGIY